MAAWCIERRLVTVAPISVKQQGHVNVNDFVIEPARVPHALHVAPLNDDVAGLVVCQDLPFGARLHSL